MLLALSLTLCGGSLLVAGQQGVLLSGRAADRAGELTAGQRETVAQLMQCLAEAAKELQKQGGKAAVSRVSVAGMPAAPAAWTTVEVPTAAPRPRLVLVHHLALPPPC